jgi:hypothetical protein
MSVGEFVKFKMGKVEEFGVKGYHIAQPEYNVMTKVKYGVLKWDKKQQNKTYIDEIARRSKEVPDMRKYSTIKDWKLNQKGKFSKNKRNTYIDDVKNQRFKVPGPGAYKTLLP